MDFKSTVENKYFRKTENNCVCNCIGNTKAKGACEIGVK